MRWGTALTRLPFTRSSLTAFSVLAPSQGDPASFLHLTMSLTSFEPVPAARVAEPLHVPVPELNASAAPLVVRTPAITLTPLLMALPSSARAVVVTVLWQL